MITFRQLMKAASATFLDDMGEDYKNYDVIGIDEGQFF